MKRLVCAFSLFVLTTTGIRAQSNIEIGVFFGTTVNSLANSQSGNIGATFGYYREITDGLRIGGFTGIDHFLSNDIYGIDASFIPVAASAKYNFVKHWFAGLDLGYDIALEEGYNGGFMFRPRAGWSTRLTDLFIAYKGITGTQQIADETGLTYTSLSGLSSVSLGLNFKF